jgi:threonine dehydrogenase-like Zn-dependent dehydrogenase
MKAVAIFPKTKTIKIIDHPEPQIKAENEVKLRILEVGVCGTDTELCLFLYGAPPSDSEYLIIGHEALGEVVAVGAAVVDLRVGDLVVPMVRRPCHNKACVACQNFQQDSCTSGEFSERGIKNLHGFMTEYIVDDARYMFKVPKDLKRVAVLTEPMTIAEKSLRSFDATQERLCFSSEKKKNALILGAGPIGLLGTMLLLHNDFETSVYSKEDLESFKAKLVKELGSKFFSASQNISNLSEFQHMDLIYEAAGSAQLDFLFFPQLGGNAVFILTGIPNEKTILETAAGKIVKDLVLKNNIILGVVNANASDFSQAISDLSCFEKKWPTQLHNLITKRYSIDDIDLEKVLLGKMGGIKNVITMHS